MVGNVWQYTDEYADAHTRGAIVRGGSNYYPSVVPRGSVNWYFPNDLSMRKLNMHGKYCLMSDSYERAGTIGFRCASGGGGLLPPPAPPPPPPPPPPLPPPPPPPPCAALLCGSVATTPAAVNLSEVGTTAWVHWGDEATTASYGPDGLVSNLAIIQTEANTTRTWSSTAVHGAMCMCE